MKQLGKGLLGTVAEEALLDATMFGYFPESCSKITTGRHCRKPQNCFKDAKGLLYSRFA
jgi:hypothetical protein